MYLLDTNVVSELRKRQPHGAVLAWLQGVNDRQLHLSAVTLGEIQAGIELTREQDAAKAAELEAWLAQVAQACNVLPMDAEAFRTWTRLMHRKSDAVIEDAMIAAKAKLTGLTVVTRDTAHLRAFRVSLLDLSKPSAALQDDRATGRMPLLRAAGGASSKVSSAWRAATGWAAERLQIGLRRPRHGFNYSLKARVCFEQPANWPQCGPHLSAFKAKSRKRKGSCLLSATAQVARSTAACRRRGSRNQQMGP